jgi:diketogulonate reductase-like aldo/keto reductase
MGLAMSETLDPAAVPRRTLATGAQMPAIGFGTFGSDHASHDAVAEAVRGALEVGYRHVDCASVYGNEKEIGAVLAEAPVPRDELWITSKLWNDRHGEDDVVPSCRQSLEDLGLEYLDLYLVHWPFPNFHPPGCDVTARSPDARPYIHESYMKTWRQMERLVEQGLVRHIGTSNMTVPKLRLLLRDAAIPPAVNEMELHPHFQQPELFDFVRDHGIEPVAYCPLGSPNRPDRDRTPDDTNPLEDPAVVEIARNHGVHPALVCLKWAVQRGQTPIPMSTRRRNYASNLRAVAEDPLGADEMARLAGVDRNCRMIKGQVFLWKENQSWEDLWDTNGVITPP